jgi:EF-P beta-lysylation protein EpmB
MITATALPAQPQVLLDWRQSLRDAVTDARELLALLDLGELADKLPPNDAGFPLRVPRGFVTRMRKGDPRDPLLLQVLPQLAECESVADYVTDAVGDLRARVAHGVLQKYQGRALLIAGGSCAVNCRYCFRRHFAYSEEIAAANGWQEALAHLRADDSIHEAILSGGDPLILSTTKLREFGTALAGIPHVRTLRIHTRVPVVLPERIDHEFCGWLAALPLRRAIVLHVNHANEIDESVRLACARLREAGVSLLNQSVLLRGINDDADALAALSERLFDCGVMAYYLHQLDRVRGTAHFAVEDSDARDLTDSLRARLPGYLVPRLVREVAGASSKTPLERAGKV